jgi:hypothetical protein
VALHSFSDLPQPPPRELSAARGRLRQVAVLRAGSQRAVRGALIAAKQTFDQVMVEGNLDDEQQRQAELQLARCECADWLAGGLTQRFVEQLLQLYALLNEAPPLALSERQAEARAA